MDTLFSLLAIIFRLSGVIRAADFFIDKWKKRNTQNAQANVDRLSDDNVIDELRSKYTRD